MATDTEQLKEILGAEGEQMERARPLAVDRLDHFFFWAESENQRERDWLLGFAMGVAAARRAARRRGPRV